jgi:tripartite-type tricarboxylate transporter receptor subunit TctC
MKFVSLLPVIFATLCAHTPAQAQDAVADFYRGKQVQVRIGSAPGSGYDIAARLVAAHIGKYIPGNPNVIVQNVPGAGSLTLTNQLYNTAARDGTVIGAITNGMPTAPMLSPETARFDLSKFGWLGSTAPETIMVMVWHTAPVYSIRDLYEKEVVVGGVAHGTATVDNPLAANAFLGTKFKIVSGYEGTTHIDLAMERGEVMGHAGIGLVTAKARNQLWFAEKKVRIIAQYGLKPHPELMDVPLFEMPKDPSDRQAFSVIVARQEYGRPLLTPPGVPPERLAALRHAFDAAMKDSELLADAKRQTLEINPVRGDQLDKLSAQIAATPPDVAARLRKVLDPANSGK